MSSFKSSSCKRSQGVEGTLGSPGVAGSPSSARSAAAVPAEHGREAPLILIEEHLTDDLAESQYRPAFSSGRLIKNWEVKTNFQPSSDGFAYVVKVQEFKAGGYEATGRLLNLEKIGNAIENAGRRRGKREAPDEVTLENIIKSGKRAKTKCRHAIKNMGATNLMTLTLQEGPNTKGWTMQQWSAWEMGGRQRWIDEHGEWCDEDEWAGFFDRFRRLVEKVIGWFPYVVVPERHRKGNFHLHVAWSGKVPIDICRRCWRSAIGGRGGNINVQYIKSANQRVGVDRSAIIARYMSKYVTKGFEELEGYRFNKKRYWGSRQSLPEVRRYILNSRTLPEVLSELMPWMGFRFQDRHNFFLFPSEDGFWWNYCPELHDESPPPF